METAPGAAGGRNLQFEQYSHSGKRDSGGSGKTSKTAPDAGGIHVPFEQYIVVVGIGILEGGGKSGKLPLEPVEV